MATKRSKRFADGGEIDGPDVETSPVYEASAKGEDLPAMEEESVKAKPKSKSKIVTKEELEKSGLSLRDYMNKQQGLTRRGSAKESSGSGGGRGPTASEFNASKAAPAKRILAPESAPTRTMTAPKRGQASVEDTSPRRSISRINPDDLKGRMKGMGGPSGFAKGGSVSASKRADGIATKGKTRGRMC